MILDLLADVGGMNALLMSIFGLFVSVWNYNHFDNIMVSHLFKIKDKEGRNARHFSPPRYCNALECFIDSMPKCVRSKSICRKSRMMRGMEKARKTMASEVNIVEIVKSRRLFFQALQILLSKQ